MKLKWWLIKNNMEVKELAKRAMISPLYLSQIKNGIKKPSKKIMLLISMATNHEVTPEEIMNPENYPDPI